MSAADLGSECSIAGTYMHVNSSKRHYFFWREVWTMSVPLTQLLSEAKKNNPKTQPIKRPTRTPTKILNPNITGQVAMFIKSEPCI